MTAFFYIILATYALLLCGCNPPTQPPEEESEERRGEHMIHIQKFTIEEKTFTLDYQVSNPFEDEIWICEDIDIYGKQNIETRIISGILQIKLCFNLECNLVFEMDVFAKYRRVLPGESLSGRIVLNLPIRNASPVYGFDEDRTKYKQEFLEHAAFVVGYIEGKEIKSTLERIAQVKRDISGVNRIDNIPEVREEIIDGQSHKFAYVPHIWPGLSKEKSAKVVFTDVKIPCLISTND